MTNHVIKMPDIGEGIAEVEIVEWHVAVGDQVKEDQILADVMTDKASVQIPSPVFGRVIDLGGQPGDILAVGAGLITLAVDQAKTAERRTADDALSEAGASNEESGPQHLAAQQTPQSGSPVEALQTTRTEPGVPGPQEPPVIGHAKPLASPSVRRKAREMGVDLHKIQERDDAGRITHRILEQHGHPSMNAVGAAARPAGTWDAAKEAAGTPSRRGAMPVAGDDGQHQIPVIGLRRKIAQKMQEAKRHIPHFTYVEEVDVTELENLRVQLNQRWGKERGRLTILPFLARAMIMALREFPQINARYDDESNIITRYDAVHLGVAAQTEAGLMVPVLRHAQSLDMWQCAAEISRLAQAARSGKASVNELSGSTITLTSLGALGGVVSTPVINHPEVGIVGVNRIAERPMIVGGAVVARKMMNLSSSFDHRVVDGMHAAQFIQAVRGYLECPATLFID